VYNFNIEKIDDLVWVFRGAIKNPKDFVNYFNENREWKDWYTFGKVAEGPNFPSEIFKEFPTLEEWRKSKNYEEATLLEPESFEAQIEDLFYHATRLYKESNNILLDNWVEDGWNIAKYTPNLKDHPDYAMMYHTDFQREFAYEPGLKFGVTAVFYLNDNYTGGEIVFKFVDKDNPAITKKNYVYKPEEGDILVFPSTPPYYHGVKAVTEGDKYIIRNYWRYDYPGHPLWLKLQEKYGEDIWRDLEQKRLKFNRNSNNMIFMNDLHFYVDFEEYYKKEIEMLDL
jgi:hypothetical protein